MNTHLWEHLISRTLQQLLQCYIFIQQTIQKQRFIITPVCALNLKMLNKQYPLVALSGDNINRNTHEIESIFIIMSER